MNDREDSSHRSSEILSVIFADDNRFTELVKSFDEVVKTVGVHTENITESFSNCLQWTKNCR